MEGQTFSNEIAFSQPVINIGSDNDNDIILRGTGIAPFHAMLHYESPDWYITPLDPSCPVVMDGLQVALEGSKVRSGAMLSLGSSRLTLGLNGINTDIIIQNSGLLRDDEFKDEVTDNGEHSILLSLISASAEEVEAGGFVEYQLRVTNAGPLVANMQVQLQGIPAPWVKIIPPVLNLNEGRSGEVMVRVSPPRSSDAVAGLYSLHFVVSSPNYPRETAVADTTLNVLPYSDFLTTGPTPRRVTLSKRNPSDTADVTILNNSNAETSFFVRTNDDSNELSFSYLHADNTMTQGQEMVSVKPGESAHIPVQVSSKKLPLFGITGRSRHYYTSVTPAERPGDGQTVMGEAFIRPAIHSLWLLILLLLLVLLAGVIFMPYIHQFNGATGSKTEAVPLGSSTWLQWNVSPFASSITMDAGAGPTKVDRRGSMVISPTASTTYTLRTENLVTRIFGRGFERQINVVVIPAPPSIEDFNVDKKFITKEEAVNLQWSVSENSDTAVLAENKQRTDLTKETFSSSRQDKLSESTLIYLRTTNSSGYETRSTFVRVAPYAIKLNRFTAWVRPNGIAIPNDNDVRRATRWSSIQIMNNSVSSQPSAQDNMLIIPDNFQSANSQSQGMNPEQMMVSGQVNGIGTVYAMPTLAPQGELLVAPAPTPTAVPVEAPVAQISNFNQVIAPTAVPSTSPEASSTASREFSVKLVEVIPDMRDPSGYRVIDYFPDYALQKGEQILLEWDVEGVVQTKIEQLSGPDRPALHHHEHHRGHAWLDREREC